MRFWQTQLLCGNLQQLSSRIAWIDLMHVTGGGKGSLQEWPLSTDKPVRHRCKGTCPVPFERCSDQLQFHIF